MKIKRTLYKTLTWRIAASTTTVLLVYAFSGELKVAGGVALTEVFVKSLVYFIHERVWEKVKLPEEKKTG
ncbi:MAG: DUF2061 domain-containing protein [Deltaproteobacteria bacterium]|jgi:uncharacterized membrane protein|nr:DUF2061 domain-containing protein [Deltaproteobacteria bacterium]